MKIKLAILGCGNMGSAITLGLRQKTNDFEFFFYDPLQEKRQTLADKTKGHAASSFSDLKGCDYFLIACKPQQFDDLAKDLKPILQKNTKIISIMAGVSSQKIQQALGCFKLARVMPNTPALIGEGAAAIYFIEMNDAEKKIVEKIFSAVAKTYIVNSDDAIDVATAMVGSGPAYFFEIARILAKKVAQLGIPPKMGEEMVKQTIKGAAHLMMESSESLEELRNKVTSKGGTTFAALESFKANQLERTICEALDAAYNRAKELSKG